MGKKVASRTASVASLTPPTSRSAGAVLDDPVEAVLSFTQAERYSGQWIAKRGRRVVASVATLDELLADPRRRPEDAIVFVPSTEYTFF